MSTGHVSKNPEVDTLSVIRELERSGPAPIAQGEKDVAHSPDPAKLLESLQKKRDLIGLIDGYANVKGIGEMKSRLNEAIVDLEEIIGATE